MAKKRSKIEVEKFIEILIEKSGAKDGLPGKGVGEGVGGNRAQRDPS